MRKTRMLAAAAGAAALAILPASGAFAHECFVIDRNVNFEGVRGSWVGINVDATIAEEVEAGLYSAEVGECLTEALPTRIAIKIKGANGNDGVLAANNPNDGLASNARGVEHIGAYFAACGVDF
jgi:hypothetical protein